MSPRLEQRLLYSIVGLFVLLITVPYLYAWHLTPAGQVYTGLLWLPDDQNVHLTWAKQAEQGQFLLPNLYSSDTLHTRPTFSNLVLYGVGLTARVTRLPLIGVYHAYRLVFAGLLLVTFHRLTTLLTEDRRVRVVATFLVAFGAGFGYLALPLGDASTVKLMDLPRGYLFVPEAYAFTSALIYPLNAASLFLQCATWYFLLLSQRNGRTWPALAAGMAALVLGNSHTYDSLPLMGTLGIYFLVELWRGVRERRPGWKGSAARILTVIMLGMVPVAVQAGLYFWNPEFRYSKTHYPVTPLPVVWTLLSFGLVVPLAVWGGWETRPARGAAKRDGFLLPVTWATVSLVLMYLPWLDFGRKLVEGLQLPLAYLAAVGLIAAVAKLRSAALRVAAGGLALAACVSSVPIILTQIMHHRSDPTWPAPRTPLDLPKDYAAALAFLDGLPTEQKRGMVVLAMAPLSNHLPPRTGIHTYVGHWAESIRFVSKFWTAHNFFSGVMSEEDAREFLAKNHITHVLEYPPADPTPEGGRKRPSDRWGWTPEFTAGGASIYVLNGTRR